MASKELDGLLHKNGALWGWVVWDFLARSESVPVYADRRGAERAGVRFAKRLGCTVRWEKKAQLAICDA